MHRDTEIWKDPIVEEIHAIREQIAREHDYDIRRIFETLRKQERERPGRLVTKEELQQSRDLTSR